MLIEKTFPAVSKQIITSVNILQPHAKGAAFQVEATNIKALWDTGASFTAISNRLSRQMNLPRLGTRKMASANGVVPQVAALCFAGAYNFDILIGMDIISQGTFLVNTIGKSMHFSFLMPAIDMTTLASVATISNI